MVIYDELGTEDALNEFVDPSAERVYVGKRGNRPSIKQAEINEMLVSHCLQVPSVTRVVRCGGGGKRGRREGRGREVERGGERVGEARLLKT